MTGLSDSIVYVFLFVSLYFEVFLLVTYFDKRLQMKDETARNKRMARKYPTVTILVPCWNEGTTLSKTVHSLLNLNYPKDKLSIILIDDGSNDNTWEIMKKFESKKQIQIFHKENGGKHTALNFGLTKVVSDLVGCLDADSYVDKDALRNMLPYFEDKETMCVTPSVKVYRAKTVIQLIQRVEYGWGILVRKMFSYMGALYVTPGPFSIFRKEVFDTLGGYRYAHLTEDMEMAMRMQANHYKIANSHDAVVYTVAPKNLYRLYKQRLRWTHGFIKNALDYKYMFFKKEYGNLGMFILPVASISLISVMYVIATFIFHAVDSTVTFYTKIQTVGFQWPHMAFDWFYINTEVMAIASLVAFIGSLSLVLISRKMTEGKVRISLDLIYFMTIYIFIAPIWIGKAIFNSVLSVKTTWR